MREIRLVLEEMEGESVTRFRLLYGLGYDTLYGGTRRVPTPGGRGLRRGWVDGARSAAGGRRGRQRCTGYAWCIARREARFCETVTRYSSSTVYSESLRQHFDEQIKNGVAGQMKEWARTG